MGEASENKPGVIVYVDGECAGEMEAGLPEIHLETDSIGGPESISLREPVSLTGTFYIHPKKCRTRKRFVKLLMADGMGRNAASWWAGKLKKGASYKEAYHFLKWRMLL